MPIPELSFGIVSTLFWWWLRKINPCRSRRHCITSLEQARNRYCSFEIGSAADVGTGKPVLKSVPSKLHNRFQVLRLFRERLDRNAQLQVLETRICPVIKNGRYAGQIVLFWFWFEISLYIRKCVPSWVLKTGLKQQCSVFKVNAHMAVISKRRVAGYLNIMKCSSSLSVLIKIYDRFLPRLHFVISTDNCTKETEYAINILRLNREG